MMFWRNVWSASSGLKGKQDNQETRMKQVVSTALVDLYWTTWHCIPKDCILDNHRHENVKSGMFCICFSAEI
jgi:hypothetical protein